MATGTPHRAAAVLLLALATIAGCSEARPTGSPPTTTPTAKTTTDSPSPTPEPEASAEAAVLEVYRAFTEAASEAQASPNKPPSAIRRYAIDKALADVLATVALYRQQEIVVRGTPDHDPEVVALALRKVPAVATIRDCVDLTRVEVTYRETGKSAYAPNQSRRHIVTAKATVFDGRWMIREVAANQKQPC